MVRMVELNVSAADVLQCMCAHVYLLVPMSVYVLQLSPFITNSVINYIPSISFASIA